MATESNEGKKKRFEHFAPLSSRGWPRWSVYLISFLSLIYLLNPTAGIIELLPDNLPWIGNIDEGAAALALWYGFLEIRNSRKK